MTKGSELLKESIPEGQLQFSRRQLIQLIWPLVVEQCLAVTIGMADTMMVASTGEAAVAGIGLVDSINLLLIQVFSALATGGAVVASNILVIRSGTTPVVPPSSFCTHPLHYRW